MILPAAFLVVLLTVPMLGGRLGALADVRLRWLPVLYLGLALQILITQFVPSDEALASPIHLASYGVIAVVVVANRRIPGLVAIGCGGALNLAAIAANGGVMPASEAALEAAGRAEAGAHFANSAAVADAKLAVLGDVFAWPEPLPLANVFSVGDIVLLLAGAYTVHVLGGSRLASLVPSRWAPAPPRPPTAS